MKNLALTAARVREQFDYNPETGVFIRKPCQRLKWQATVITSRDTCGYLRASVDGVVHRVHRLVWLFHYGDWPKGEIDHINRDRTDNRIANLRDVSRAVNCGNRSSPPATQGSVYFCQGRSRPYRARIRDGERMIHLGYFENAEQAREACLHRLGTASKPI